MEAQLEMKSDSSLRSCVQAWDLAVGFIPAMVAKAACELAIPDMLAEGPLSARQIAERLQAQRRRTAADEDGLTAPPPAPLTLLEASAELVDRMMRFLSIRGVFQADPGPLYSLTPLSAWLLRRSQGGTVQDFLLFETNPAMQAPWQHLSRRILVPEDDVAPFNRTHATDVWGLASMDARFGQLLNAAMSSSSHHSLHAFLGHYQGLEEVHTLVDVGGGTGTAASYIAARFPSIKVINFDLPHVLAAAPLHPGVEHVVGDMFQSIPKGDVIFMKWVLHDWNDQDCIKILNNCRKALAMDGKIVIMDAVLEDVCTETSPFNNLRMSLDMIMMAHTTSGKERTREQWKHILHASKFCDLKFVDLPCPQCIIEAIPDHTSV